MKAVVQRVAWAQVEVEHTLISRIEAGLMVLVGVMVGDGIADTDKLAKKVAQLRIFETFPGKMSLSVNDTQREVLAIPQFTLLGDCRKGCRPDFTQAAKPDVAKPLFDHFCRVLAETGIVVKTGIFQAHMAVSLLNDGPVTILLDSRDARNPSRHHGKEGSNVING